MAQQRTIGRDTGLTARMALTMVLLGALYAGFILVLWAIGLPLVFLIVVGLLLAVFQYFGSEKMVLWSMRAKVVEPQQAPRLHEVVERLSLMAGIPKPRVAISPLNVPNAFATGRNPRKSVICVTTGIMNRLSDSELDAVLGHELTHIKNRDVRVMTIASFFLVVISMVMHSMLWMTILGGFGGMGGDRRGGGQLMILMMLAIVVSFVTYVLAQLLIMALSRYRELAADRGGAVITGRPMELASALRKIQDAVASTPQRDLREVKEGASAFFIIPALRRDSVAAFLSTHPPVQERVRRLREMQLELEG